MMLANDPQKPNYKTVHNINFVVVAGKIVVDVWEVEYS